MRANILLLLVGLLAVLANAALSQEAHPPDWYFPRNLHCSELDHVAPGPNWQGIKVGVSTLNDLRAYLDILSPSYSEGYPIAEIPDMALFSLPSMREGETKYIPHNVRACIKDSIIMVLAIDLPLRQIDQSEDAIYLDDVLAAYGIPDAVAWTGFAKARLLFWFDEGLAVDTTIESGYIVTITFFPYLDNSGYENRYPFKYVRPVSEPPPPFEDYDPVELNPFDFEDMLLTMTAEPSRTPTSTAIPYSIQPTLSPSTATNTPTPDG